MKGHILIKFPTSVTFDDLDKFIKSMSKRYQLRQHLNHDIESNITEITLVEPTNPLTALLNVMEGAK